MTFMQELKASGLNTDVSWGRKGLGIAPILFDHLKAYRMRRDHSSLRIQGRDLEAIRAALDFRCECSVCVVYGGDCSNSLRQEVESPVIRRMERGMLRARSRNGKIK
jgi:hypothetical protein